MSASARSCADDRRRPAVLVVAHRLSTGLAPERIVVMESGRVRSVGPHAELLIQDAVYAPWADGRYRV
jgi:ABC-type multidrug transport system fused ATPase/permease subunit